MKNQAEGKPCKVCYQHSSSTTASIFSKLHLFQNKSGTIIVPSQKTKPNSALKKFQSIKVPESKLPSDGGGGKTWLEQFVVNFQIFKECGRNSATEVVCSNVKNLKMWQRRIGSRTFEGSMFCWISE